MSGGESVAVASCTVRGAQSAVASCLPFRLFLSLCFSCFVFPTVLYGRQLGPAGRAQPINGHAMDLLEVGACRARARSSTPRPGARRLPAPRRLLVRFDSTLVLARELRIGIPSCSLLRLVDAPALGTLSFANVQISVRKRNIEKKPLKFKKHD